MQIQTRPITLLDFAKLAIYGIFLNYYCFNILRGSLLPNGTLVFYSIAIACVFISVVGEKIKLSTEIGLWIAYVLFSLVTVGFAVNSSEALKGIWEYVQRLLLIIMIAFICEKDNSVGFAIRLLAITAITCAASSLLMSEDVSKKLTMVSGANVSTNDIGAVMAFGCFAVLFAFGSSEKKRVFKTIIKIAYIVAAVSVIFIAGSRKSLLAIMIFFVLLFLLCARDLFKNLSVGGLIVITLLMIIALAFVYYYLLPNVESTDMYRSVFGSKVESKMESDETRIEFYRIAWKHFLDNPLFGLGFNNFNVVHNNYSHSTFAEPIACSGIGSILYLAPYVTILVKQIKLIRLNKNNYGERLWQKELLAFYFSFLFVGLGIPYMYKDIPCILFAMFIASQKISFDTIEENEKQLLSEGGNYESIPNQSTTSYC